MSTIIKYFNFLIEPFTKNLHHLISILVLISTYDIMYFFFDKGYREHVICLASHLILLAYLSVVFYSLLPRKINSLFLFIVYLFSIMYFLLGSFSYFVMHINPRSDFVFAIMGTNPQEASEFLSTFINVKVLLAAIGIPVLLFIFSKWIKKHNKGNKARIIIGITVIAMCSFFFLKRPGVWVDGIVSVYYYVFHKYERCPDLTQYTKSPQLSVPDSLPKNIVIVIGESAAKDHHSLYGYKYHTNPKLETLRDDSLLFVYSEVIAPGVNTIDAFKYLLNTFHSEEKSEKKWYESTTLFDVARTCGYKSAWLSNQSKHGIWDNLVGKFSELCDTSVFVGNQYAGSERQWYDGELLHITKNIVSRQNDQNLALTIIHLMGSHEHFFMRYPSEFSVFQAKNYNQYPENQRVARAEYDNTILYSDYVVSEIFNIYSDKEAIVFYFPDHGLDVYDSDPNYFGHATPDPKSREVGLRIPFVIYASPLFQQHFPATTNRLKASQQKAFRTDNLIYAVMDAAGISFKDNDDVKKNSLFSTP